MRAPVPFRWSPCFLLALALLVGASAPAWAGEPGARNESPHVDLTLLSDAQTIVPGASFRVGVHMRMEEAWHVYWKEPGDAGLAPTFAWSLPPGFEIDAASWPVPAWHKAGDIWTIVYAPEVLVVFRVRAPDTLPPVTTLSVRVDWLVCHDAHGCKPGHAELSVRVPRSKEATTEASAAAVDFDRHERAAPRPLPATWRLSADRRVLHLAGPGPWTDPQAVFEFYPENFYAFDRAAVLLPSRDAGGLTLALPFVETEGGPPASFHGVLAVRTGTTTTGYAVGWGERVTASPRVEATQDDVVVMPPSYPAAAEDDLAWAHAYVDLDGASGVEAGGTSWALAVLLALLGGLLLNLMPCVLPVLSLKVLGLVDHAQEPAVRIRRHGYAFSAGIITSFLAMAGLLLVLRGAGAEIGWGFQMQEPAVVAALGFLMLLLALNLFGVFEIGIGLTRFGGAPRRRGYAGAFATGVLTTVVATPCTAPFMGAAIGYALTQTDVVALSVFGALGVGMSAPYALTAAFPRLLQWVPKPGPWMETFRQVLAFPLLATVVWLAWVFGRQMGGDSVPVLLAGLLMAGAGAWLYGRFGGPGRSAGVRWLVGRGGAAILLAVAFSMALRVEPSPSAPPPNDGEWATYSGDLIRRHQDEGRPVFLNFTADWCLTCKANDATTLRADAVTAAFAEHGVVPMLADWTRRDERITKALSRLDRSSVPQYVIVPSDPTRPVIVLRTAITPGYVISALLASLR